MADHGERLAAAAREAELLYLEHGAFIDSAAQNYLQRVFESALVHLAAVRSAPQRPPDASDHEAIKAYIENANRLRQGDPQDEQYLVGRACLRLRALLKCTRQPQLVDPVSPAPPATARNRRHDDTSRQLSFLVPYTLACREIDEALGRAEALVAEHMRAIRVRAIAAEMVHALKTVHAALARTSKVQSEPANAQGAATPKRRGRKKADYKTIQKEAALAARWVRARDAGVYKPVFAKDNKLTVKELDKLLDRVAKRKRDSE
jgi:hypothetical protein